MKYSAGFLRSLAVITPFIALVVVEGACSSDARDFGGGAAGKANTGASGAPGVAGMGAHAGLTGAGGAPAAAGSGAIAVAGSDQQGVSGAPGAAGAGTHTGGSAGATTIGTGGKSGSGSGGASGAGSSGGKAGSSSSAGASTGGASGDPCSMTTDLTGGTKHASSNASGTAAGLSWTIWSNGSGGSITTYDVPAFSADWANSGDFLARIGLQWNDTKTYDQYGTISAQYAYKKTGTGGGYSYIGMYGWSVSPCIEWYIVDDSFNNMPVNPGSTTNKGTATIDGGTYTLYTRPTTGTGGSKCSGTTSWTQFYSVRQKARQCGQISLTAHFDAWAAAGMALGKMDQAQILVEVGGGSGSVDFTVANVTAQ